MPVRRSAGPRVLSVAAFRPGPNDAGTRTEGGPNDAGTMPAQAAGMARRRGSSAPAVVERPEFWYPGSGQEHGMVDYTRFPGENRGSRRARAGRQAAFASPPPPRQSQPASMPAAPPRAGPAQQAGTALPALVGVFILALCTPVYFNLGGLALTPARVLMVLIFVPVMMKAVSGALGKWRVADTLICVYASWIALSLFAWGGLGVFQFVGITIIETLTPYFLARITIRNSAQYNAFLRLMLVVLVCLAGLAAVESTTGHAIVNRILDIPFSTYSQVPETYEKRLGMMRSQTVFLHPILFGLGMAMFFAPFVFMPRKGTGTGARTGAGTRAGADDTDGPVGRGGLLYALPAAIACFFSLSTGAWLGLNVQLGLMLWGRLLREVKARWKILIALTVIGYVVVDLISNRTPFEVFTSYMTLNSQTSYWRVLIFMFGMDNVWANPIFGIGLGDWVRPAWMHSASVDNFWLLNAMRYGIPGFVLAACLFASVIFAMGRAKIDDAFVSNQRNAIVFALVGCILSLCTVHIWSTTLYLVMFFLGTGLWMADDAQTQTDAQPEEKPAAGRRRGGGPARTRP